MFIRASVWQVLKGCKVLFSRLWHVGLKNEDQPQWLLASILGAMCTVEPDDSVTHLVTTNLSTDKVSIFLIDVITFAILQYFTTRQSESKGQPPAACSCKAVKKNLF